MTAVASGWAPLAGAAHAVALEALLHGPLPRSELARRLGLTAGAMTRITRPLVDQGLLVELDPVPAPGLGRPVQPLDVVPTSHHFIGVKLTGVEAHAVLTTLRAQIVASEVVPLPDRSPAAVVETVAGVVRRLAPLVPEVSALGVSVGGLARDRSTVADAIYLGWREDVPLGDLLAAATGLPTVVENDVVAWTEAEHWFGAGRVADSFALVTIGAGVGYGLVVHDRQVAGPDAALGVLGHVPLASHGPMCPDGHRGCATAMLTIPAICASVSAGLRRPVDYDEVFQLVAEGNRVACGVVAESARALGGLLALVANLTMPERIVVAGEGVRLVTEARAEVDAAILAGRHPLASPVVLDVGAEDFGEWALGAAVVAIQTFVLGSD